MTANTYVAGLENTMWVVEQDDVFGCQLSQEIPRLGKAVFFHEAGLPVRFSVEAKNNPMKDGLGLLIIEAPGWGAGKEIDDLGVVQINRSQVPMVLDPARSYQVLDGLTRGMRPMLTADATHPQNQKIRVGVSPVNFKDFLPLYDACVANLLPQNFRQLERSKLYFKPGSDELEEDSVELLNNIIAYVRADDKISRIFVDGHSDNVGRRFKNRRLSEARSMMVIDFLHRNGMNQELMVMRFHGERYPTANNQSVKGRALNRRVTLRLLRDEPVAIPVREGVLDDSQVIPSLPDGNGVQSSGFGQLGEQIPIEKALDE